MRKRTIKVLVLILMFVGLLIMDRYLLMDNRIVDNNWSFESGDYMGVDPMHFGQHCDLRGNKVFFYEEKKELRVLGCYLGQLFLYDPDTEILTRYIEL